MSASLKWMGAQVAKRSRVKAAGEEHDVSLAIHRSDDDIGAMHIQGHIAADLGRIVHG